LSLSDLARQTELSYQGLQKLRDGKTKGVQYATLEAICRQLHVQVNRIIEYVPDP
jgi:putative transcriptional regulator